MKCRGTWRRDRRCSCCNRDGMVRSRDRRADRTGLLRSPSTPGIRCGVLLGVENQTMTGISLAAAAVLVPIVGSELALGGTKLQTGLTRVLVVWIGGYIAAVSWLVRDADSGLVALTIFWNGAFLIWFGVRSHIESSILLRMLFLLRDCPMTDARLVDGYTSRY